MSGRAFRLFLCHKRVSQTFARFCEYCDVVCMGVCLGSYCGGKNFPNAANAENIIK